MSDVVPEGHNPAPHKQQRLTVPAAASHLRRAAHACNGSYTKCERGRQRGTGSEPARKPGPGSPQPYTEPWPKAQQQSLTRVARVCQRACNKYSRAGARGVAGAGTRVRVHVRGDGTG